MSDYLKSVPLEIYHKLSEIVIVTNRPVHLTWAHFIYLIIFAYLDGNPASPAHWCGYVCVCALLLVKYGESAQGLRF